MRTKIDCRCGAEWKLSDFIDNDSLVLNMEINADLLEACKEAEGWLEDIPRACNARRQLEQAIDKAEGR